MPGQYEYRFGCLMDGILARAGAVNELDARLVGLDRGRLFYNRECIVDWIFKMKCAMYDECEYKMRAVQRQTDKECLLKPPFVGRIGHGSVFHLSPKKPLHDASTEAGIYGGFMINVHQSYCVCYQPTILAPLSYSVCDSVHYAPTGQPNYQQQQQQKAGMLRRAKCVYVCTDSKRDLMLQSFFVFCFVW